MFGNYCSQGRHQVEQNTLWDAKAWNSLICTCRNSYVRQLERYRNSKNENEAVLYIDSVAQMFKENIVILSTLFLWQKYLLFLPAEEDTMIGTQELSFSPTKL